MRTISRVHRKVHSGDVYTSTHYFGDITNGTAKDILIQVGANKELHCGFSGNCGGDATIQLYKVTSFSAAGTALNAPGRNNKLSSSKTTDATFTHTPTSPVLGDLQFESLIPGGTGGNAAGGSDGGPIQGDAEWILDKSNDYILRVTNVAGATKKLSSGINYYEED